MGTPWKMAPISDRLSAARLGPPRQMSGSGDFLPDRNRNRWNRIGSHVVASRHRPINARVASIRIRRRPRERAFQSLIASNDRPSIPPIETLRGSADRVSLMIALGNISRKREFHEAAPSRRKLGSFIFRQFRDKWSGVLTGAHYNDISLGGAHGKGKRGSRFRPGFINFFPTPWCVCSRFRGAWDASNARGTR